MLALRRLVPLSRSLHSSSSALRKAKAPAPAEEEFSDDLFDDLEVAPTSSDRAARRAQLIQEIAVPSGSLRTGTLRKVVQLSDSPEELESLGSVLKSWRVAGKKVTDQTAQEIVGRCINLGRADLAQAFTTDRLKYGLPELPPKTADKLKTKLA